MLRPGFEARRGVSLMEILVSMLIMVIGVTSVIALFPVGVLRVRQAVLDTRSTIASQNAKNLILAKQMPNDPALVRFDLNVDGPPATNPDPGILDAAEGNAYAWAGNAAALPVSGRYLFGKRPSYLSDPANETTEASYVEVSGAEYLSYPVLVDPYLYELIADPAASYIPISTNYANPSPYHDIRVASLAEIHGTLGYTAPVAGAIAGLPCIGTLGGATTPDDKYRRTFLTRWFSSLGDVRFDEQNPVLPNNPIRRSSTQTSEVVEYDYSSAAPRTTAERQYPYSWAFMIQRRLINDPDSGGHTPPGNRSVARPARDYSDARVSVLCFYRRNLSAPNKAITVLEGCIFNGSRKVTLSWEATKPRPEIKKGTWICEATIAKDSTTQQANRQTGIYPPVTNLWTYRRSYNFYKVVDYEEPIIGAKLATSRVFQRVTIDRTPAGYSNTHPLGDLRAVDGFQDQSASMDNPPFQREYRTPAWPVVSGVGIQPHFIDRAAPGIRANEAPEAIFYPILIFDGLVEVFE